MKKAPQVPARNKPAENRGEPDGAEDDVQNQNDAGNIQSNFFFKIYV